MEVIGKFAFGTARDLKKAFEKESNIIAVNALRLECENDFIAFNLDYGYVKSTGEDAESFYRSLRG